MSKIYNFLFHKSKKKCLEEATMIYQIKEFNGEIWLTYNGALICPTTMFSHEPAETLAIIRNFYAERNSTEDNI